MEKVITIPALGDNYIYLYRYEQNNALVVDPSDAGSVFDTLEKYSLNLTHVLATHHHFDHVGGVKELKKKTSCKIIGSDKNSITLIDRVVKNRDIIEICGTKIIVIATPGHTRTSVCYYIEPSENRSGILFTGDTLFIAGCGRLIECDVRTMWESLQKIAALPDDTLVYPGHDYTEENYNFALTIEPDNKAVKSCLEDIKKQGKQGDLAVPSTLTREKATNVFLRSDSSEIRSALDMPAVPAADVFAELRQRKDVF